MASRSSSNNDSLHLGASIADTVSDHVFTAGCRFYVAAQSLSFDVSRSWPFLAQFAHFSPHHHPSSLHEQDTRYDGMEPIFCSEITHRCGVIAGNKLLYPHIDSFGVMDENGYPKPCTCDEEDLNNDAMVEPCSHFDFIVSLFDMDTRSGVFTNATEWYVDRSADGEVSTTELSGGRDRKLFYAGRRAMDVIYSCGAEYGPNAELYIHHVNTTAGGIHSLVNCSDADFSDILGAVNSSSVMR